MKADWMEWVLRISFILIIVGLLTWSFYWEKNHPDGLEAQHSRYDMEYPINFN